MAVTKHERRMQRKLRQRQQQQRPVAERGEDRGGSTAEQVEEAKATVEEGVEEGTEATATAEDMGGKVGCTASGPDDARSRAVGATREERGSTEEVHEQLGGGEQLSATVEPSGSRSGEERPSGRGAADGAALTSCALVCGTSDDRELVHDHDTPANGDAVDLSLNPAVTDKPISGQAAEVTVHIDDCAVDFDDAGRRPAPPYEAMRLTAGAIAAKDSQSHSLKEGQKCGLVFATSIGCSVSVAAVRDGGEQQEPSVTRSLSDAVESTIEQLERDVRLLVCQKMVGKTRPRQQPTATGGNESSPSLSDSPSTNTLESDGQEAQTSRSAVYDSDQQARIHQLEAELAQIQRKAEVLDAEKLEWTKAAGNQEDFRSQLLAEQVEHRALVGKLRRIVQMLDDDEIERQSIQGTVVAELRALVQAHPRPPGWRSSHACVVQFSESLVFPAKHKIDRRDSTPRPWNWLLNHRDHGAEDYTMSVMRLHEVPLKRQRSNSDRGFEYDSDHGCMDKTNPSQTGHSGNHAMPGVFSSSPQLKRSRIQDIDNISSDEEEFICHVDSTGKVTALDPQDASVQDVFLAVSM